MNPTLEGGGLPLFMISPRKDTVFDLRLRGHDTYGCFPACSSVVQDHVAVHGGTVKVLHLVSLFDTGEENFTGVSRGICSP